MTFTDFFEFLNNEDGDSATLFVAEDGEIGIYNPSQDRIIGLHNSSPIVFKQRIRKDELMTFITNNANYFDNITGKTILDFDARFDVQRLDNCKKEIKIYEQKIGEKGLNSVESIKSCIEFLERTSAKNSYNVSPDKLGLVKNGNKYHLINEKYEDILTGERINGEVYVKPIHRFDFYNLIDEYHDIKREFDKDILNSISTKSNDIVRERDELVKKLSNYVSFEYRYTNKIANGKNPADDLQLCTLKEINDMLVERNLLEKGKKDFKVIISGEKEGNDIAYCNENEIVLLNKYFEQGKYYVDTYKGWHLFDVKPEDTVHHEITHYLMRRVTNEIMKNHSSSIDPEHRDQLYRMLHRKVKKYLLNEAAKRYNDNYRLLTNQNVSEKGAYFGKLFDKQNIRLLGIPNYAQTSDIEFLTASSQGNTNYYYHVANGFFDEIFDKGKFDEAKMSRLLGINDIEEEFYNFLSYNEPAAYLLIGDDTNQNNARNRAKFNNVLNHYTFKNYIMTADNNEEMVKKYFIVKAKSLICDIVDRNYGQKGITLSKGDMLNICNKVFEKDDFFETGNEVWRYVFEGKNEAVKNVKNEIKKRVEDEMTKWEQDLARATRKLSDKSEAGKKGTGISYFFEGSDDEIFYEKEFENVKGETLFDKEMLNLVNEKKNFNTLHSKLVNYYNKNVISYLEGKRKGELDKNVQRIILDELKSDPLAVQQPIVHFLFFLRDHQEEKLILEMYSTYIVDYLKELQNLMTNLEAVH